MAATKYVQYICKKCGQKDDRPARMGRPAPGFCERNIKPDRHRGPHSWTINKRYELDR